MAWLRAYRTEYRSRSDVRAREQRQGRLHKRRVRKTRKGLLKHRVALRKHYHNKGRFQKYGITKAVYEARRLQQGNACRLCRRPFTFTPVIDHCHATGLVRGLLCRWCNTALGVVEKRPWLLDAIPAYLRGEL
jgi:hypothetical protein